MKYVYLLKAGTNHYKVGIAVSVTRRVKSIQTSNANRIYIVTAKLCKNAPEVERNTHKMLRQLGAAGGREWFVLEPEDVLRVAILLNQEPEIDVFANTDINEQLREQSEQNKRLENKLDIILKKVKAPEKPNEVMAIIQRDDDMIYDEAKQLIKIVGKASTSMLQRRLKIGYGRAARILEELEVEGYITEADGTRPRSYIGADIAKNMIEI